MGKAIIKFNDIKIKKQNFHQHEKPISTSNIDINKIAVPNKVSFGKKVLKYLIGYKDAKKITPSCIFFSKNECI